MTILKISTTDGREGQYAGRDRTTGLVHIETNDGSLWVPEAEIAHDSECGHCHRTWNSILTPTPAARCPFEIDHIYRVGDEPLPGPLPVLSDYDGEDENTETPEEARKSAATFMHRAVDNWVHGVFGRDDLVGRIDTFARDAE